MVLDFCADREAWDRFVDASPQGSVFSTSRFLAAVGGDCELLTVREGQDILLAVPVVTEAGQPRVLPYSYLVYAGPMFSAEIEREPTHRRVPLKLRIFEFLLEQMAARWPVISFLTHPALDDLRALQWFNYHAPEKGQFAIHLAYTGILRLGEFASESAFLEQVRTLRHRDFKKAEAFGLVLEESRDIAELDRLHGLTFERQGIDRSDDEIRHLRAIGRSAVEEGFGHCLIARTPSGAAASATLFLHDRHTAYYLFGANDPEFRKVGAGSWLMLKSIEHARQSGRRQVDFVGVNSPNRGDFKTSFGAVPVPCFSATWRRP